MKYIVSASALAVVAAATVAMLSSSPAQAKGCGGYVNVAVWGCAPWDNNPAKKGVTPGYKAPTPVPIVVRQPPAAGSNLVNRGGNGLVAAGGGNLVAAGGGNLVAAGGGNLVAAGGGNLVAAGGGNLIKNNGNGLVAAGGGNLVAQGAGNFRPQR